MSERLPLDDGELPPGVSTEDAEHAIELLLAEARRLVAYGKDRGKDWWWLVSNMLVLDGKTELASKLVPYDESHSIGEWRGTLSKWDGHHGIFLEVHTAIQILRSADQRIRQSEGGKKGGRESTRTDEVAKAAVREWYLKRGRKRPTLHAAILYLTEHWDECGMPSGTEAPSERTLYKWLEGIPHKTD